MNRGSWLKKFDQGGEEGEGVTSERGCLFVLGGGFWRGKGREVKGSTMGAERDHFSERAGKGFFCKRRGLWHKIFSLKTRFLRGLGVAFSVGDDRKRRSAGG